MASSPYCAEMIEDVPENRAENRIAKLLAHAGAGSRRDIERMIVEGRVRKDGETVASPAVKLSSLEGVTVDGVPVKAAAQIKLWRYHKPKGLVTTHKDPEGRKTIFQSLPAHIGRVISVGRLDLTTEGLLLLTNDGDLSRWMELPGTALPRTYRARVYGRVDTGALEKLKNGLTIEGVRYGPIMAKLEKQEGANGWVEVTITEGKNREVRRVLNHLGLTVNRLIRTAYGPFRLGALGKGAIESVTIDKLEDAIGPFLKLHPEKRVGAKESRNRAAWARPKMDDNPLRRAKKKAAVKKKREAGAAPSAKPETKRCPPESRKP